MKILLTETATLIRDGDLSLDVFKGFGDVTEYENISLSELKKEVSDTDIILCNKTLITKEIMDLAPRLKYIGTFATGYNNIDVEYASKKGITVCNAAGYSTNAVTAQVMGYILMHYTKIAEYNEFVKSGGWKQSKIFSPIAFSADEVCGKKLGIVGYGSIGKSVRRAARALGMKVIVNTRTVTEDGETSFVGLDELLEKSDVVTMHCPLNEQSRGMMNKDTFAKMKKGAFFINTSRGGVVVEEDLRAALESGHLSGAAVDVLNTEPMTEDNILFGAPNLIITPHSAWSPYTTRKRLIAQVADNLESFLKGKPKNKVN